MFQFRQIAAPAVVTAALMVALPGCAPERPDQVPAQARVLSEGSQDVAAVAPHDGTVYIWDKTANKQIYTARVMRGDNVRVDAKNNKVMLNEKLAVQTDLPNDHDYKVFFDRSQSPDVAQSRQGETTVVGGSNTTVVTPSHENHENGNSTVVRPDGTVVQPNGTTVTPNGTTVTPDGTTVSPDGTTVVHH